MSTLTRDSRLISFRDGRVLVDPRHVAGIELFQATRKSWAVRLYIASGATVESELLSWTRAAQVYDAVHEMMEKTYA